MKFGNRLKKILLLLSPLALYPVIIFVVYRLINFVDIFGCGCYFDGKIPGIPFNGNDVNGFFWQLVTVCMGIVYILLSRKISKNKIWLRVIYIVCMIAVSLLIAYTIWDRTLAV